MKNPIFSLNALLLSLAPVAIISLLALPFRYDDTLSEPDVVRMMAALVYGQATGGYEGAGQHYGIQFSFGYYRLLYSLAPSGSLRSPEGAAQLINGIGIVFGLFAISSCTAYLSALFGRAIGTIASLFAFGSPMMLPVVFSGHPLIPATACLFAAGWMLITANSASPMRARVLLGSAMIIFVVGLSMRAEIVIAFPFLAVAAPIPHRGGLTGQTKEWAIALRTALLLGCSFAVFLYLQRPYVSTTGGATGTVSSYLNSAKSLAGVPRGLGILVLGAGLITTLGSVIATIWLATSRRGRRPWEALSILALLLPALVLWLPDPLPARHLFFPMLALSILVTIALVNWQHLPGRLIVCVLAVMLGNQAMAEVLHPVLVANYQWTYASIVPRRAAQRAPTGVFPLDQLANQATEAHLSDEATRLAQLRLKHLLFFGDLQHYVVAHLVAQDPSLHWAIRTIDGINIIELRNEEREIVLIEKYSARPRDVQAEMMNYGPWAHWPIYVQPSTRTSFDRAPIPASRLIRLGSRTRPAGDELQ